MIKLFPLLAVFLLASCHQDNSLNRLIQDAADRGLHEIVIPPGFYKQNQTIELVGVNDLVIRAGGKDSLVMVTSSRVIHPKKVHCLDTIRQVYEIHDSRLKDVAFPDRFRGYAGWPELYVNGLAFHLARYPNTGYLKADSIRVSGSEPRSGDSIDIQPVFISQELTQLLSAAPANDPEFLLDGYWRYQWYDETIQVDSVDFENGVIRLAAPHFYGLGDPTGALFYALNHPLFLDQPQEYYYDPDAGKISFILPDFMLERQEPEVRVVLDSFPLIRLINCKNVQIEGLTMAYHAGTAIVIENCDSVTIDNCRLSGIARTAIRIEGGSSCGVRNTSLSDLGGQGILLSGGNKSDLTPARHFVTGCSIVDFAQYQKTYAPGVNLQGVGQIVTRNVISRSPHNAILFSGNDHLIERNHISQVCLNTSDAGAIYCGRDWTMGGTVIRQNSIQQVGQASHHHNWAIYLDDLASGITVEMNTIDNCPSGILVGGGRYNRIVGNRISTCPKASIMYDARGLNWYIPYLDDPEHTLWTRLYEVPVQESPWKDRFPWLQHIAQDDPGIPKAVEILENEIVNSAPVEIHPTVIHYGNVQKFN